MSSLDIFSMAFRNLFKRKLRTFLTILGVVVGCAAIVTMISLGLGINRSFEEMMKGMGDVTRIEVYNYEGYYGQTRDALVIDDDFIRQMERMDGVQAISPYVQTYITVVSGRYSADINITGINPSAMAAFGYVAAEGRLLEDGDMLQVVFGSRVPMNFSNARDRNRYSMGGNYRMIGGGGMVSIDMGGGMPMQEEPRPKVNVLEDRMQASFVQGFGQPDYEPDPETQGKSVKPYRFDGVGILQQSETDWDAQYSSFMTVEQVLTIIEDREKYERSMYGGSSQETYGYQRIMIKATDVKAVDTIIDWLLDRGVNEYSIYNPRANVRSLQDMMGSLQGLLGAIGAVSLFVAAIGIANTMVMSIYERTREIGVMKVIGASIKDIKRLFLTEAAAIGLLGGVFGVGLSLVASYVINNVGIPFFDMFGSGTDISYVPVWLCVAALAFSATIGLLSGYFPARRAMRLSALSAIRAE